MKPKLGADTDDDTEVLLLQGHAFLLLADLRQRIQRMKRKNLVFGLELYLKNADDMEHTIFNLQFRAQQQQHRSSESWPTPRRWLPLNYRLSLDRLDRRHRTSFYLHDCDDPDRHDRDFKKIDVSI